MNCPRFTSLRWLEFNETPVELDSYNSSDDNEFALSLDSDSEEWDEECFNLASEEDPEANKRSHFQLDDTQIDSL
jgi:hypothetical protein